MLLYKSCLLFKNKMLIYNKVGYYNLNCHGKRLFYEKDSKNYCFIDVMYLHYDAFGCFCGRG